MEYSFDFSHCGLYDFIKQQRINSGDKIIFAIAASGRIIGTALYTLDDLPDRLRQSLLKKKRVKKLTAAN